MTKDLDWSDVERDAQIMRDDYLSTCGTGVEEIDVKDIKVGMTIDFVPDVAHGHLWVDVTEVVHVYDKIKVIGFLISEHLPDVQFAERRFSKGLKVLEMFPVDPETNERVPLEVYAP